MVKTRKVNYKRKYKKLQKKWYNKKYSVEDIAMKALSGVNYLREKINVERKFLTSVVANQGFDYNGYIHAITGFMGKGDNNNQRNGMSVLGKSIYIRGSLFNNGGSSTTVRIILFRDNNDPQLLPTPGNVIDNIGTVNAPNGMLNRNNLNRFTILHSRMVNINADKPHTYFKIFLKMHHHIRWAEDNAPGTGQLYLLFLSNETAATQPAFDLTARFSYYDN